MGIGDWGLGIGGLGGWAPPTNPKPHNQNPKPQLGFLYKKYL